MERGEFECSNQEMLSSSNFCDIPDCTSIDIFLNDILKDNTACTHTHTCNPPGPDTTHTHTCYHAHTKIVPAASTDDSFESTDKSSKPPTGNREAVRKYREKKKARVASLEDEVIRLRALNQQLLRRVQNQSMMEAEISRLKCLLVDIRGRIEGEIGCFPYQKPLKKSGESYQNMGVDDINLSSEGLYVMNTCNVQCGDGVDVGGFNDCSFENPDCGLMSSLPNGNGSRGRKRKGAPRVDS
ncbi:unnamed protein product [Cuscuta epithymum]|uniref:BZIP domain-containing protein n=1 Tax=Cuscuta epithymum TaxID=186058 RepID=A0AAV0CMK4_9ASTE|nr:unnamed protein product [Cuscuta epithymum]